MGPSLGLVTPVPQTPPPPQMCHFHLGLLSFGVQAIFIAWGVCIHPALSAWSIPSQWKRGDTSSRKPSWIRCLDSGSHSPGLTSTLGGWAPGGSCLFLPLSSHRAVSPWGQMRHSWLSSPASSTQPGREEHKCRTKVWFFPSTVRSLRSRPIVPLLHALTSFPFHGD